MLTSPLLEQASGPTARVMRSSFVRVMGCWSPAFLVAARARIRSTRLLHARAVGARRIGGGELVGQVDAERLLSRVATRDRSKRRPLLAHLPAGHAAIELV